MVEFDQIMWGCVSSTKSPGGGPHTSSIGVAALGVPWYVSSHPDPRKSPQIVMTVMCRFTLQHV